MSISSPVIASIDGEARRIYLNCGIDAFDWLTDVYAEYKYLRTTVEELRKWYPLVKAKGGELKENGERRESYLVMIDGTRVVPCDEEVTLTAIGEILTDDPGEQYPFDLTGLITPPTIRLVNPNVQVRYSCVTSVEVMADDIEIEVEDAPVEVEVSDMEPEVEITNEVINVEVK